MPVGNYFVNAPVSKAIFIVTIGSSLFVNTLLDTFQLRIWKVLSQLELWRLVTCHFPFETRSELVMGLILLWDFRKFERILGSDKFAAFVVFVTALSSSVQAGVALCLSDPSYAAFTSGPYSLIYAMLYLHHAIIPVTQPRMMTLPFGVTLSNKSLQWMAAIPMLWSRLFGSLVPGCCGFLAGWMYINDMLSIQSWRIPKIVSKVFRLLEPALRETANFSQSARGRPGQIDGNQQPGAMPASEIERMQMMMQQMQMQQMQQQQMQQQQEQQFQMPPPSEDEILALMQMGFERAQAVQALTRAGNNVEVAANYLLSGT